MEHDIYILALACSLKTILVTTSTIEPEHKDRAFYIIAATFRLDV